MAKKKRATKRSATASSAQASPTPPVVDGETAYICVPKDLADKIGGMEPSEAEDFVRECFNSVSLLARAFGVKKVAVRATEPTAAKASDNNAWDKTC